MSCLVVGRDEYGYMGSIWRLANTPAKQLSAEQREKRITYMDVDDDTD